MKNFKAIIGTTLVLGCFTILMFNKIKTLPNQWHDPETILYQAASKITHKHDIYLSGLELSCPQGRVYELGLSLHTKKPYSLEEGRKIVVDAAEILLKQINTDP